MKTLKFLRKFLHLENLDSRLRGNDGNLATAEPCPYKRASRGRVSGWVLGFFFLATALPALTADEIRHPLDPLTAEEISTVVSVLHQAGKVDDSARYPHILLAEPLKKAVLDWKPGDELPRRALAIVKKGRDTFEALVDLRGRKVESWEARPGVQASFLIEEFLGIADIVKQDPAWQAAMQKRGFASFDKIYCAPFSPGWYGVKEEENRRLVRALCFDTSDTPNFWGRPIENLVAIVDLDEKKILRLVDDGVVPVPRPRVDYDEKAAGKPRERKPLVTEYAKGNGFTLTGNEVAWQHWRFHVRTDPRAGLVLSLVRYQDGERLRSVLYQGSLSEIFVPYSDPTSGWYFRTYLDAGEYGAGKLAVPLVEGTDCPPTAVYLSDVLADDHGKPQVREKVACLFEREAGDIAWRHYDFVSETTESRRARDLVVRQIAAIGNYDYVFDWTFREDGTIKVSVGATGIAEVKGVKPKNATAEGGAQAAAYGRFVDDHLVAINHDHFLNFRLDVDIDGTENSFVMDEIRARVPSEGLRKSIWTAETKAVKNEHDARLHMSMERPAQWRVVNPRVLGARGYPVSYELMPGHNAMSILSPEDFPTKRAGFTDYMLWVTPYVPNERWAAGDYPNRSHGGDGLPRWTEANRPIEDTDVVLWYTVGFHHVVRPEDWPVMPTSMHEFALRAFGFFDRNPALDLPK